MIHPGSQKAIGDPGNQVLFMDDHAFLSRQGSQQGRRRCKPAGAKDQVRPEATHERMGPAPRTDQQKQRGKRLQQLPAGKSLDRQGLQGKPGSGHDFFFHAAHGAHEQDLRCGVVFPNGSSHGQGRVNMPSRPSSGNHYAHVILLNTCYGLAYLEILIKIPRATRVKNRELPPALTRGRLIPVMGIEPVTTPTLISI